jgi:phosphopantetheinyl transferase (holo-ACP synthase)
LAQVAMQAQSGRPSRWQLTLRPGDGRLDARTPYLASTEHRGRIVVGNPLATPLRTAGLDLLDVPRFQLAALRCGEWLERRLLSGAERAALSTDPVRRLHEFGCVFSVKESVLKALGGIPSGGRYPQIEVEPPSRGQAGAVRLRGALAELAAQREVRLLAGALPVRDGLVLSWALALQESALQESAQQESAQQESAQQGGKGEVAA